MRILVLLGFLVLVNPAYGQTERVLSPFDTMLLESGGARWLAQLWVHNKGTQAFRIPAYWCSGLCQEVKPGESALVDVFQQPNAVHPGVVLTLPQHVTFHLRVRDANKGAEQIGTELPVVRESELLTGTTTLINVPMVPNTRPSLRIYFLRDEPSAFTVRLFGEPSGAPLAERTFTYVPAAPMLNGAVPMIEAGSILRGWVADALRVTIEPHQGGAYYPLLTITNQRNNQITTVTPQ